MVPSWVITQGLSGEISGWEGRSRWDRGSHRPPENGAEILGHVLWPETLSSSCGPLSWVVRLSTPMPEAVAVTDGAWTPASHRYEFKSWLCCHELRDVENFTLPLWSSVYFSKIKIDTQIIRLLWRLNWTVSLSTWHMIGKQQWSFLASTGHKIYPTLRALSLPQKLSLSHWLAHLPLIHPNKKMAGIYWAVTNKESINVEW